MDRLIGVTRTYKSHDTAGVDDRGDPVTVRAAIKLLNKDIAPEIVRLKVRSVPARGATIHQPPSLQVGCQVMLIKVCILSGHRLARI